MIDGGRVGDDDFTGCCTNQWCQQIAQPELHLPPAFIPGADQTISPLVAGHFLDRADRSLRQPAQRVPVEVNQVWIGVHELLAKQAEWIGFVERAGLVISGNIGKRTKKQIRHRTSHCCSLPNSEDLRVNLEGSRHEGVWRSSGDASHRWHTREATSPSVLQLRGPCRNPAAARLSGLGQPD